MTDAELVRKAYLDRKSGGGSAYNYELAPLIKDFSFYDFIAESEPGVEHGGFIVITDKQYIVGYNAGFGVGAHMSSFARVMKDIRGGGDIIEFKDAVKLSSECCYNYTTARITYENMKGYINFDLNKHPISQKQFEVFKKFYEDYNREISGVIRKYGISKFKVSFKCKRNGNSIEGECENLDELLEFFESDISNNPGVIELEDEKIIGTPVIASNYHM